MMMRHTLHTPSHRIKLYVLDFEILCIAIFLLALVCIPLGGVGTASFTLLLISLCVSLSVVKLIVYIILA